ncbi:hypothetical protein U9M48_033649 [Paspalum notatum var. saurae]|uniref:DUF674 family protein n=1 Tax=Paspalum notatum var. saurae TaxID=547442 RepID=A0AAQ3X5X8_PASNO
MAKVEEPTIDVKLFVDKAKGKVLCAESDKEFVDVLFSFLTMPLGTIVRLMDKQSQMGCLHELCKSVEDLSTDYFQTKACKAMLLAPLNAASNHCSQLKINVDDPKRWTAVYACKNRNCCAQGDIAFSLVPDIVCKCGSVMQDYGERPAMELNLGSSSTASDGSEDGVFVKRCFKFIITDDLQVAPASTSLLLSLFQKFEVREPADIEQKIVRFDSDKITSLIKRALTSQHALSGHYFKVPVTRGDANLDTLPPKLDEQVNEDEHKIDSVKIRLFQTKSSSSLLYAEVGGDFVDLLFGLLSVPVGSIMKIFGQWPSKGCLGNLYNSTDGSASACMRPECQSLLLAPKSAPFFGCSATRILNIDELVPRSLKIDACSTCLKLRGFANLRQCRAKCLYTGAAMCSIPQKCTELRGLNPKSPAVGSKDGEDAAYVKAGHMKFMVTDDLGVLLLSLSTALQIVSEAKIQTEELVEQEIIVTTLQIAEIHRAALMGRHALSSVLIPPKKAKKLLNHVVY